MRESAVVVVERDPVSLRDVLDDVVAQVIVDARSAPEAYLIEGGE